MSDLAEENAELRERVKYLEGLLMQRGAVPAVFGLTPKEYAIVGMLVARNEVSKDQLMTVLYGDPDNEPASQVLSVFVSKARGKLLPFGVEISTIWGRGWSMSKEAKAKVAEYLAAESGNG